MGNIDYRSRLSNLHLGIYFGLALVLAIFSIFTFLKGDTIWTSIILLSIALFCTCMPIISYNINYELSEKKITAKWIFGTKEIEYDAIKAVKKYNLPISSIRRLGISMMGGRYSNEDKGKFYAIYGSQTGILIEADESSIYGGKLFISPKNNEDFLKKLRKRIE